MKVICISSVNVGKLSDNGTYAAKEEDKIISGEYYHVAESCFHNGKEYYRLHGKPKSTIYSPSLFILTSEKDEIEIIARRKENV